MAARYLWRSQDVLGGPRSPPRDLCMSEGGEENRLVFFSFLFSFLLLLRSLPPSLSQCELVQQEGIRMRGTEILYHWNLGDDSMEVHHHAFASRSPSRESRSRDLGMRDSCLLGEDRGQDILLTKGREEKKDLAVGVLAPDEDVAVAK